MPRKWSNKFEGADEFLNGTIRFALVAAGITLQDINDDTDGRSIDVASSERPWLGVFPPDVLF